MIKFFNEKEFLDTVIGPNKIRNKNKSVRNFANDGMFKIPLFGKINPSKTVLSYLNFQSSEYY